MAMVKFVADLLVLFLQRVLEIARGLHTNVALVGHVVACTCRIGIGSLLIANNRKSLVGVLLQSQQEANRDLRSSYQTCKFGMTHHLASA